MTKLLAGCIPPRTVCPWREQCPIYLTDACHHTGEEHSTPFSCASARGYDILNYPTDKEKAKP